MILVLIHSAQHQKVQSSMNMGATQWAPMFIEVVLPLSVGKFKDESGYVAVYIDDLIVFSNSADDHKRHLLNLLDILSKERLYLNNEKSHYFCKYTRYLGAVCGYGVLLMCPEKIRSIVDMPT
eukprot:SAG11_NODE_878_length_6760_cov_22.303558_3_plen_123_part_00